MIPGPFRKWNGITPLVDFDRLEMGSGFHIEVEQGNFFDVTAWSDRRNIEDLVVIKEGSTLVIRYRNFRDRRHDTHITITMPELNAVNFSGAGESRVRGFHSADNFDVYLSGASRLPAGCGVYRRKGGIVGSILFTGKGQELRADLSGASAP